MRSRLPWLLLLGCAIFLLGGILRLFELRFEGGDIYPLYSSFRADPLGSMAFYESLNTLPGVTAIRDLAPGNRLPTERNVTYLHLAAPARDWVLIPDDLSLELESFLQRGGRFVITLYPESVLSRSRSVAGPPTAPQKTQDQGNIIPADDEDGDPAIKLEPLPARQPPSSRPAGHAKKKVGGTSVKDRWGLEFTTIDLEEGTNEQYLPVPVARKSGAGLPDSLNWHSGLVCTNLSPEWKTIYSRDSAPVVVERSFGKGTLVVATDSYFVSNEAIARDRQAALLSWLAGGRSHIYFDEAHLGVVIAPGVSALIGKYRLQGLVGGLFLLAGLFIWKNATSLAPRRKTPGSDRALVGKDVASGFINLLRRNLPDSKLNEVCYAEWKKSAGSGGAVPAAKWEAAESAYRQSVRLNPVIFYQSICAALGAASLRQSSVKKTDHES